VTGVRPIAGAAEVGREAGRGRRLEAVRRAGARGARTTLRYVTLPRRGAAGGRRGQVAVHAMPSTVTGVRPIAGAAVGGPDAGRRRRLEAVRRAGARGARTTLRYVTLPRRGAASGRRGQVAVHAMPSTVTGVRPIAGAAVGGPDAGRRRRLEAVRRAGARGARATLRYVTLPGRGAAGGRCGQEAH